jgi:hypothetical protein
MRRREILSENWRIKKLETKNPDPVVLIREALRPASGWLEARMPAEVHDILLEHELISDPHIGKNAVDSAWVGEEDWAYMCTFTSPERRKSPVFLRFEGLDTLAEAYLNGTHIGNFNNMFRSYSIEINELLAPPSHDNALLIIFFSPLRFIKAVEQPREHHTFIDKYKYMRKPNHDFKTYLGARPHSVKVGVHRDIVLDAPDRAWIEDIHVRTNLSTDLKQASVEFQIETLGTEAMLSWELEDPSGNKVKQGECDTSTKKISISVANPKLWWPWTHGNPYLYYFKVDLKIRDEILDRYSLKFGIRDIRPIFTDPETGEERFQFEINGKPIFLQGACWAPVEGVTHCWRHDRAMRLLDLAQHARMNILRIWASGHIPPQEFYDECDRRGILVWQDFMFGYGMHPAGYRGFEENCRLEVEEVIRRLRNHPCILLWCGGNENYMGWNFDFGGEPTIGRGLFERIMPEACTKLDPSRYFHLNSPYGGRVPNWPLEGDWHDYTTLTLSHEASVPTFASEVGRVSAPSIRSMRRFLSENDLWPEDHDPAIHKSGEPAWPPMWQYRSPDGSWDKVGPLEEFCDPSSAEDLIRVLGTAHGEYLERRVGRHRRGVPDGSNKEGRRCGGNMVWRLNDPWPILYWSIIDYYLEPKIPFYFLKRTYSPVLVCFEKTLDRLAVWVVNDSTNTVADTLTVRRLRFDGTLKGELETNVKVKPGESRRCLETVDLGPISLREEFLHASFAGNEATYLLSGERYLHLPQANLSARYIKDKIEVTTDVFARQIVLEIEGTSGVVFEDNFFDLKPRSKRKIGIINPGEGKDIVIRAFNAEPIRLQLPNSKAAFSEKR